MFAQIFLGIWMLICGGCHYLKLDFLLRNSIKDALDKNQLASFQRGLVFPYLLLGVTFIMMGIVESKGIIPLPMFLAIYITLGAVSLIIIIRNNKKYLGRYIGNNR